MDSSCAILVVDDDPIVLELLTDVLSRDGHTVLTALSGQEAIRICQEQQVEVMILDYMMPHLSGEDVVRAVRQFEPDIQIILQTAVDTLPARRMLQELEIQGFHHKGNNLSGLLMWVDVAIKNYEQIRNRRDLEQSLLVLGLAMEARDLETAGHTKRVVEMAELMGRHFGLNRRRLSALRQGAYLHDLGKLCIPDEILLKPGKLSASQWQIMKTHAALGHELASSIPTIKPEALDVIRSHHERWDGKGYPDQLSKEAIPLLARIFAICDVFDALISSRIYKPAWLESDAIQEIYGQHGKQFDPEVTSAFISLWSKGAFDQLHEHTSQPKATASSLFAPVLSADATQPLAEVIRHRNLAMSQSTFPR